MNRFLIVLILGLWFHQASFAQTELEIVESNFVEEEKDEKTRSFFIWIPGILTKGVSLFINKEEEPELKQTLRFIGGLRIRILNGNSDSAKWKRKTARWERRIKRKKLEDLMVVQHENNTVIMKAGPSRKGKIKKYALLVNADDAAVLLIGKSRLDLKEIVRLVQKVSS